MRRSTDGTGVSISPRPTLAQLKAHQTFRCPQRRSIAGGLLLLLGLLVCTPAFAATFEKKSDWQGNYVLVKSEAPRVEVVILDRSGQKVESAVVQPTADKVVRYYVKYEGPFEVQVRDIPEEELHRSNREQVRDSFYPWFYYVLVPLSILVLLMVGWPREDPKAKRLIIEAFRETTTEAFRGTGLYPIGESEIRLAASQAHALLQPPFWGIEEQKYIGPVFSFRIGGHDAYLYEWVYYSPTTEGWTTIEQHAYIVLGLATPYLRLAPKRVFGKPANTIDFPDDRAFSKAFWVEGTDEVAVRRFLGPDLRKFLLSLFKQWRRDLRWREWRERLSGPSGDTSWPMSAWRFHAGPEGVALVLGSRTGSAEAHHIRAMFERLVTVTEAAARRAR